MTNLSLTILMFLCSFELFSQNPQTMDNDHYKDDWKKVIELEQKSLPQSAAEVVNTILQKAIQEKNSPQVIKALIHQGKYELARDAENDTLIFGNLHEMVAKSSDVTERSVLHSMLGELYLQYYQKEQWTINQRTELGDFVPADMKEWTRNIFYDKVTDHLNASLSAQSELEKRAVEPYADVVDLGKDSRRFYPTMYDFLARRAIELFRQIQSDEDLSRTLSHHHIAIESLFTPAAHYTGITFNPQPKDYTLWTWETYRKLLASLLKRDMLQSVLLTELEKLDDLSGQGAYATHALPALEALLKRWKEDDFSVEIIDKIASFYQYEIGEMTEDDSLKQRVKTRELYNLLDSSIRHFPDYERISLLKNRLQQLTLPRFFVTGNQTFPIKGDKKLKITYRNLTFLTAKLYKIHSAVDLEMAQSGVRKTIEGKRTFLKNIRIPLPEIEAYLEGESSFNLDIENPGTYMLTFHSSPEASEAQPADYYFAVSDLAVFSRSSAKDRYDFFVVNRVTGAPVKNAKINIYKLPGNWRNSALTPVVTIAANEQGMAVYHKEIPNNDVFYQAVSGNDNGSLLNRIRFTYFYDTDREVTERETVTIFTDRSLYRPGQTVYYKAVFTRSKGIDQAVVSNRRVDFVLRDANQEVSKQTLQTNDYGSASGEFVLPTAALPGDFTIETNDGNVHFRVEEYKRPSFEVTFDKIDETYTFGEEITLKGKAANFSGIKLQHATVAWRITRQQPWWWHWGGSPEHFAEGIVTSDEEGEFMISFTPQKKDTSHSRRSIFSFMVEATVTDLNGETQTGTYTVTVGDVSMVLQAEMPDRMEKESDEKIVITARNLDGADITARGTYQVYTLEENDSLGQLMIQGEFETGAQPSLREKLTGIKSGKYRLKLQSRDDRGNPVETETDFMLYSFTDKRPPFKTNDWFVVKESTFTPGKNAEVILGVSDEVHVLYELWQENTLLERKWLKLRNENRLFSFPYKNNYQNGVTLMLSYVKDEKFYAQRVDLRPGTPQKALKVKLDVFRDKIRPGAGEEWRLSVTDAAGNPSLAEVLASMYDFSLDKIYPSQTWSLGGRLSDNYYSRMWLGHDRSFQQESAVGNMMLTMNEVKPFIFDRFQWYGFSFYHGNFMVRGTMSGSIKTQAFSQAAKELNESVVVGDGIVEEEISMTNRDAVAPPPPVAQTPEAAPQIRRNFNETAFFYPQLKTNEKGEVQVAFTVPESNTRWRFRVLAHDKDLNTGTTEAFTVSQKELMVTPSMPRFMRHGDKTTVSTKISNLSDSTQLGKVTLELFNPVNDELLDNISVTSPENDFTLASGASAEASWTFDIPSEIDLIGVRIVAETDQFSDGEQHALAVLPNRMLVTETLRLDVNGNQTKRFTLNRLQQNQSETMQHYRLTLEFASNPAWYAVQALPVMGQPVSDNALEWFAVYYANMLGAHIADAYPKVSAMVEAWKKQGASKETFLSDLEKNQELKNILLEETPWVIEANTEAEQRERLSLLFDLNHSNNLTRSAFGKLQQLQTNQGGWSWFEGLRPSVSITQYILYGLHQLKDLNVTRVSDETASLQAKAISFIDAEAIRRFADLKRQHKKWKEIKSLSVTDLEYLYVRTAYTEHPQDEEVRELTGFYRSVMEKNWTSYGLYERSLIAVLMQREGKEQLVQQILNSYREHATVSSELGMYWPNNRAQVFMSQSAISVHTFIMDAFRKGGAQPEEVDNMKRWLLKQKQTQIWESTHATADAVYMLLSTGADWFSTEGKTTIKLGNTKVEPDQREWGTGYFKETWGRGEITSDMAQVEVAHQGNAPAWGALYWQYYEDLDKITKTDASLDIEKQLFVERTDASGTSLIRVTEENPLVVGDKVVVRLTVRTDRDMEFVHLKDMRAAAFEPVSQLSGTSWQDGILYYQTSKDASSNYYFDLLPRGTYLFESRYFVTRPGIYSNGITTIQSLYAPGFTSHTAGIRIIVKQ